MTSERDSVRVALESLLLLLYAWNSCPVPGTEISRSMIAVGREFAFPFDYSSGKHWQLTSSPNTVETYSKELAIRLGACREVAELLVREHREWHRELINSRRQDPRVYSPGDIVFARRAIRSDASRERVGKLEYKFTGPWRIVASLCVAPRRIVLNRALPKAVPHRKETRIRFVSLPCRTHSFRTHRWRRYTLRPTLQTNRRKPIQGGGPRGIQSSNTIPCCTELFGRRRF